MKERLQGSEDEVVLYNSSGGIARITLNRPEQINAFNVDMRDALFRVL